jgi:streptogrisin C
MPTEAPADDAVAAAQLAEDYGLPLEEAEARIAREEALLMAADEAADEAGPGAWGGAYIDHTNGGALVLQATDLSAIDAPSSVEGAVVITTEVDRTMAELSEMGDVVGETSADIVSHTEISVQQNVLEVAPTLDAPAHEVAQLAADLGEAGTLVEAEEPAEPAACYVDYTMCDDPLRSGTTIYANTPGPGGAGHCTTGFNVQSNSDNKAYILTAGHCVTIVTGTRSTVWTTKMPQDHLIHEIGPVHNHAFGTIDGAIIRINNPSGWAPTYRQLVYADGGPMPTVRNTLYPILQVGGYTYIPGGYLCRTGASSQTDCGEFLSPDNDVTNGPQNLGRVDMQACEGDSGGGVFRANRGYGIVSHLSGSNRYSRSVNFHIGPPGNVDCGNELLYQGLTTLLNHFNVRLYGT